MKAKKQPKQAFLLPCPLDCEGLKGSERAGSVLRPEFFLHPLGPLEGFLDRQKRGQYVSETAEKPADLSARG